MDMDPEPVAATSNDVAESVPMKGVEKVEDEPADGAQNDNDVPRADNDAVTATPTDDDDSAGTAATESSDQDTPPQSEGQDPEIILMKALALKEEGNTFFKQKDYEKASRAYRRGTTSLKPLNKGNTGDDQVKSLLISLQTNLSMMCFKMDKHKQSFQVAASALAVDPTNVKARYRRAVASRKLGDLEQARDDLREALKVEPANSSVKKELAAVKKELDTKKAAQKKSLQKAFQGKGGSFLYNDKEEEEKRKAEEEKLKMKEEEEARAKRKVDWEDECVKRMAKGEDAISFEEWDKERVEKEEAEKKAYEKKLKEEEKKRKEEEKKRKEERRRAKAAAKAEESDSDDEKLTESELAQFRGYKKTADGRVTSYFTREQSSEEKNLIGDIAPKRLESGSYDGQATLSASSGNQSASVWNKAGTWEEKDTTEWCRSQLKSRLKETKVQSGSLAATVSKVENLKGDASVATVNSKKRYIFDMNCTLKFKIRNDGNDEDVASGSLHLPDICSTHHEELEVTFTGFDTKPSADDEASANDCRISLAAEVRESVKRWVNDFNEMY